MQQRIPLHTLLVKISVCKYQRRQKHKKVGGGGGGGGEGVGLRREIFFQ